MIHPGCQCPTCGLVVPLPVAPRAGRHNPDTSKDAARASRTRAGSQKAMLKSYLAERRDGGMTDDEADQLTGWGHATTSARMSDLRKERVIGYLIRDGVKVKRKTRRNRYARVNVLAEYCVQKSAPNNP